MNAPACVSCGSTYCLYREDPGEWWCNDCWSEHTERPDPRPA